MFEIMSVLFLSHQQTVLEPFGPLEIIAICHARHGSNYPSQLPAIDG